MKVQDILDALSSSGSCQEREERLSEMEAIIRLEGADPS
jgi:hypothetical protein